MRLLSHVESLLPLCFTLLRQETVAYRALEQLPRLVQVTSPVQWETSLKTLLERGLEESYEIGPNKVIAGIMKRIDKKHSITNVVA